MSITATQTRMPPWPGGLLTRDSRAACVFEPRQNPRKSWVRKQRKIINKNIWDISPIFRHLTSLESVNRFLDRRKCAPNYAQFMTNNSFRINPRSALLRLVRIHPLTVSFHESCFTSLLANPQSTTHDARRTTHDPRFTPHPSVFESGGETYPSFRTSLANRLLALKLASKYKHAVGRCSHDQETRNFTFISRARFR